MATWVAPIVIIHHRTSSKCTGGDSFSSHFLWGRGPHFSILRRYSYSKKDVTKFSGEIFSSEKIVINKQSLNKLLQNLLEHKIGSPKSISEYWEIFWRPFSWKNKCLDFLGHVCLRRVKLLFKEFYI